MPSWKKVIVSGSDASLKSLYAPSITGSFTGSFAGDGSQLTGIISSGSSKWTGSNPISRQSDVEITGSLKVSSGFINVYDNSNGFQLSMASEEIAAADPLSNHYALLDVNGRLRLKTNISESTLQNNNVTNSGVVLEFPNKSTGNYTIATINDLNSYVTTSSFNNYTGSSTSQFAGTASFAITASYFSGSISNAITASYAFFAETASSATNAQDVLVYVLNNSGYNIAKGVVVHITASGNMSDIPRIVTASYENDANSANTLGITNESITNGSLGYVMTEGILKGVDTSNFQSGQLIFLGATGSIIGSAPQAPLHGVRLGQVVREQTNNGSIYVSINNGYEIDELHDVRITTASLSYGDLLMRSGSVWINSKQLSGSYEVTGSLFITGSSNSTLLRVGVNDLVVTGSRIGIGTTAPVDAVEIVGPSKYIQINGVTATDRSAWIGNDASGTGNVYLFNGTNSNTVFITGNGSSFLNGGNVGIGIAQAFISASLHISGTNAATLLRLDAPGSSSILHVTGSGRVGIGTSAPAATLNVAGTTILSGSRDTNSGSILAVIGSGSTQPVFTVQGSQGELFSVTDSLSGSLFSVNDISGLPILEVFSDNTTLIGNYLDPMLITTAKVTQTNSGSFTVYSLPTASYDTAFFEYSIKSGSNARAGTIMAIQSGSLVNYTETTTTDFGTTSAISLGVFVTGSNMALTGSSTTGSWTIKTIVRSI